MFLLTDEVRLFLLTISVFPFCKLEVVFYVYLR